jgi:antitoxin component of RelBE/YafQ-DinJ toxin-antitoxin module
MIKTLLSCFVTAVIICGVSVANPERNWPIGRLKLNLKAKEMIAMPATQTITTDETFVRTESHEPNEETIAALRESADMRNLIGPFHNVEDLMASLLDKDDT